MSVWNAFDQVKELREIWQLYMLSAHALELCLRRHARGKVQLVPNPEAMTVRGDESSATWQSLCNGCPLRPAVQHAHLNLAIGMCGHVQPLRWPRVHRHNQAQMAVAQRLVSPGESASHRSHLCCMAVPSAVCQLQLILGQHEGPCCPKSWVDLWVYCRSAALGTVCCCAVCSARMLLQLYHCRLSCLGAT